VRVVLAALLLGACTIARSTPPGRADTTGADAAQEVRERLVRYYESLTARDWAAFGDHFWPGAAIGTVWQPPGTPAPIAELISVPQFVARAPEGPGSKPIFEERMTDAEVRVHANLAQAWTRYTARFGDSSAVATWRGIDAFTLLRLGGRWRIVSVAYTDLDAPPPDTEPAGR
jgi:hypothetical protein